MGKLIDFPSINGFSSCSYTKPSAVRYFGSKSKPAKNIDVNRNGVLFFTFLIIGYDGNTIAL